MDWIQVNPLQNNKCYGCMTDINISMCMMFHDNISNLHTNTYEYE